MSLTDYIQDATFAEQCECLHHLHLLPAAAAIGRPNWNIALECVFKQGRDIPEEWIAKQIESIAQERQQA